MHTWGSEIDLKQYNPKDNMELHYFKRKMSGYEAHIIIVFWKSEEDLIKFWRYVDSFVALNIQSKIELLIERSNFYICHFVTTTVDKKIKREIEQDPFCAKKYIYDNRQVELQEACEYIEKRIFSLEISQGNGNNAKLYVQKIKLKNFRGYEGNIEIDLSDKNNTPASFTVVYAPNGVGKTSLFDGVEYALKGEVTYLKDIQKISKFKGPVYHNKKYFKEEAYTGLILSDGSEICRKVSSVKENGTDLNIRAADKNKGSDFVGLKEENTKWDCIILPHAKIDSFISAKKPDERYEEWFQSAPELANERNNFEKISKEVTKKKKDIEEANKEIGELQKKQKKLESTNESFKTVQKLIRNFNEGSDIKIHSNLLTKYDYNELLNDIQKIKREYENMLKQLSEKVLLLEKIEKEGLKECRELFQNCEIISYQIQQLKKNIERRVKFLEVEKKYIRREEVYKETLEKIKPYKSVIEEGKDGLIGKAQKYKEKDDRIKWLKKNFSDTQKILKKLYEEVSLIEKKVQEINNLFDIKEEVFTRIDRLNRLNLVREKVEKDLEKNKKIIDSRDEKILRYKDKIEELQLKTVPKQIEDWDSVVVIELGSFLEKDLLENINDLNRQYQNIDRKILFENQNNTKVEKILLTIKENGKKYQESHRENCECPLCHSKFESWDSLYDKIVSDAYDFRNNKKYLQNLFKIREDINKEYDNFRIMLEDMLIKETNKNISSLQKVVKEKYLIQKDVSKSEEKLENIYEKIDNEQDWLELNNILSIYEKRQMVEYYSSIEKQISNLQLQLKEKGEDIKKYENISREMNKKIENYLQEKEKTKDNPEEYPLISFLLDINMEFDANYKTLLQEKEKNLKNMEVLKEEMEQYLYIKNLDGKQLEEELHQKEELYKKEEKFIKDFTPYKNYTDVDLEKIKSKYSLEEDKIKRLLEILQQIYEENNVKLYFTEYKQVKNAISKKDKKVKQLTLEREEKKKELDKVRGDLEDKLSTYFSKSIMNDIYRKIDPHDIMKRLEYHLSFNDLQKGELFITLSKDNSNEEEVSDYRPEIYFSTAQLNTVAFSSFFSRALEKGKDLPLQTIFIDDPIGHFDDMNVLGFADLIRSLIENSNCQIVMSTHDEKVLRILQRKLSDEYYSSCFLILPNGKGISWEEK